MSQGLWTQLVVPRVLGEVIIQELHSGTLEGHLGKDKTTCKNNERLARNAERCVTIDLYLPCVCHS